MSKLTRACAFLVASATASTASAALTALFQQNAISPAAIAADPALANMQCWSVMVTNTDGHWASAGLRMTLPAGHTFYQTPPARGGGDTHANPLLFGIFPELEFDTYVSSARNQAGQNPPAILGAYPENQPPQSFGGATDAIPGTFAVSWGDPQATSGPGPGTYEIVRFTFPLSVLPGGFGETSQVAPDQTINIDVPEPATAAAALAGLFALALRRGSRGREIARPGLHFHRRRDARAAR